MCGVRVCSVSVCGVAQEVEGISYHSGVDISNTLVEL